MAKKTEIPAKCQAANLAGSVISISDRQSIFLA